MDLGGGRLLQEIRYKKKCFQKIINEAAGFVLNIRGRVINLNWLPQERVVMAVSTLAYEDLFDEQFPAHSKLKKKEDKRSTDTDVWKTFRI